MAVHSREIGSLITNGDWIANEVPTGLVNSINTVFNISKQPVSGTVIVTLNGLVQKPGSGYDYVIAGQTITFMKAPRTNSEILVHYVKEGV